MSNDIKLQLAVEGAQAVVTDTQAVGKAFERMGQSGASAAQDASAGARRIGDELRRMGQAGQISAGQTAAAFRQLPMQLQDVAVSLQGGMNPFTVLMQQGPQITSSFGGVAPTIRALGPAVLGLVNPFTLAAAAGAALFGVYEAGRSESAATARALIMTGNAAGATAGQLSVMAQRLDGIAGTQGKAADVLTQLAGAGGVARDMLERTAAAAIALERAGGPAAEATVKAFSDLGKDPLQASIKLNEATNYLTASTIRQIKALVDLGDKVGAAKLAQEAYASAMEQRTPELEKQLGTLQRGWRNIGDAAAWAWDKMLNVGRERGVDEQLQAANERLARMQADIQARYGDAGPRDNSKAAQELRAASAKVQSLQAAAQFSQAAAQADGARAASTANVAAELRKEEEASKAAAKAAEDAAKQRAKTLGDYRDLVDDLAGAQDGFASDFNNQAAALYNGWVLSGDGVEVYNRAFNALLAKQPFAVKQAAEVAAAEKAFQDERRKRFEEIQKASEAEAKAAEQSAQSVVDRVQALRDEEDALRLAPALNLTLAEAIEALRIARLEEARAQALTAGDQEKVDAINREIAARRELGTLTAGKDARKAGEDDAKASARRLESYLSKDVGTDLAAGFDKASQSLGAFVQNFGKLMDAQDAYDQARKDAGADPEKLAAVEAKFARQQINAMGSVAGAAKGLFKERTAGYRILATAEKAFRVFELATAVTNAGVKLGLIGAETAAVITGQAVQTGAVTTGEAARNTVKVPGVFTAFMSMLGPFGIPAAVAALAAIGLSGRGGGYTPPANNTGTGTVLGDPSAKSESIAKSIEALADVDTLTMRYSAQMLASLRNIEASLGGVASLILRGGGLTGIEAQAGAGFKDNALRFLEPFGKSGVFGTKTTVQGSGIQAGPQSLGAIMASGLDASFYTDVERKKKAFGITYSTSNRTILSDAGAELEQQFGLVLRGMADTVSTASAALGRPLDEVQTRVASFVVRLGRIELKGLDGKAIQERLAAVFGAEGDRLAAAVLPGLGDFQRIGEGYLETVTRVASGVEVGTAALDRLGVQVADFAGIANKQGDVGAELVRDSILAAETTVRAGVSSIGEIISTLDGVAGDLADTYRALTDVRTSLQLLGLGATDVTRDLIRGAGDLDALKSGLADYEQGFFSEAEQHAAKTGRLRREFERLGVAMPTSTAGFRALVEGIDGTTAEGQQLQGALFTLASQFLDVADAAAGAGAALTDEIKRIRGLTAQGGGKAKTFAEAQSNFAITTARARARDAAALAALPEASRALLDLADQGARTPAALLALQNSVADSLQATLDLTQPQNSTAPAAAITGGAVAGAPVAAAPVPAAVGLSVTQTNADLLTELRGLRADVAALREEQETNGATTATATDRMQRLFARIAPNDALLTRALG